MDKIIAATLVTLLLGGCGPDTTKLDSPSCRSAIEDFEIYQHEAHMLNVAAWSKYERDTGRTDDQFDELFAAGRTGDGLDLLEQGADANSVGLDRFCWAVWEPYTQVRPKYERVLSACGGRSRLVAVEPDVVEAGDATLVTLDFCRHRVARQQLGG